MDSILPFPASVQRLSSLRTLCLSNLRLDGISIMGELVTLEILRIRGSQLEELPVEIGKLTNLIMLELRNDSNKQLKKDFSRCLIKASSIGGTIYGGSRRL